MKAKEKLYIFYYTTNKNPYDEIIFHKKVTKRPSQCGVLKTLMSMQSSGEICTIGYRTQYENEIITY